MITPSLNVPPLSKRTTVQGYSWILGISPSLCLPEEYSSRHHFYCLWHDGYSNVSLQKYEQNDNIHSYFYRDVIVHAQTKCFSSIRFHIPLYRKS